MLHGVGMDLFFIMFSHTSSRGSASYVRSPGAFAGQVLPIFSHGFREQIFSVSVTSRLRLVLVTGRLKKIRSCGSAFRPNRRPHRQRRRRWGKRHKPPLKQGRGPRRPVPIDLHGVDIFQPPHRARRMSRPPPGPMINANSAQRAQEFKRKLLKNSQFCFNRFGVSRRR
jgi:hypothetical protein